MSSKLLQPFVVHPYSFWPAFFTASLIASFQRNVPIFWLLFNSSWFSRFEFDHRRSQCKHGKVQYMGGIHCHAGKHYYLPTYYIGIPYTIIYIPYIIQYILFRLGLRERQVLHWKNIWPEWKIKMVKIFMLISLKNLVCSLAPPLNRIEFTFSDWLLALSNRISFQKFDIRLLVHWIVWPHF